LIEIHSIRVGLCVILNVWPRNPLEAFALLADSTSIIVDDA